MMMLFALQIPRHPEVAQRKMNKSPLCSFHFVFFLLDATFYVEYGIIGLNCGVELSNLSDV
jgi:hypothetical protein